MTILHVIFLAVVEGVSEFLPISSTGHLILASELLGLTQTAFLKSFEIFIQLGAICAVVLLYSQRLVFSRVVLTRVAVAFLPSAVVGWLLYAEIKGILLGNGLLTVATLFFGGILFILFELLYREREHHVDKIEGISIPAAFGIGLFQSIAMIPGISRAGASIFGGLLLGTKRKTAVEFSFLLAIPTMVAASGFDFLQSGFSFTGEEYAFLIVGFIVAFVVAMLAIKTFLRYIAHHTFILFGVYRVIVALLFWLFVLQG